MKQMTILQREIQSRFVALFGKEPLVVRSPGRINLIGEHTDYNDGFVMPAAIDREAVFAIAPSDNGKSIVYSHKFNQEFEINLGKPEKVEKPVWANYLLGVLYQFLHNGHTIRPFNCVFGGDVPVGAGMSSSAAIECGFAFAINELNNLNVKKLQLITMAQWAEHNFVGVKCGIMDQFASVMGKEDHVILLDCRSLVHRYSPIDLRDTAIILCDSKVKHSLVDSEYNARRSECEKGVAILRQHYPQLGSLRDVSEEMLAQHRREFPGKVYDRCAYVVQEIRRVQEASIDLEKGNLTAFGKKMYETHEGLSKLYQVSCPELDFLVSEAQKSGDVLGSRLMGGGFGGCTINLVKKEGVERFRKLMQEKYMQAFSIELPTYIVNIQGGTSVVSAIDIAHTH
jgi:galactokinase